MTIEELAFVEGMTQRSVNACILSGITNLSELLRYKASNPNFLKLKNCGRKSNLELFRICDKYRKMIINGQLSISNDLKEEILSGEPKVTTFVQMDKNVDISTLALRESMSMRGFKACLRAGLTSLRELLQYYHDYENDQFLTIQGCGVGTNNELIQICEKYDRISTLKPNAESFSPLELLIKDLKLNKSNTSKVRSIIMKNKTFQVFSVIDSLIDGKYIFKNSKQLFVFKNLFYCYLGYEKLTLDEAGKILGFTGERSRQIRNANLSKLPRAFQFIKDIHYKVDCQEYINNLEKPIVCITDQDSLNINKAENTNFSPFFISFILSIIYSKDYYWLGEKLGFIKGANSKQRFIKKSYLVKRTIASNDEFEKLWKYANSLVHTARLNDEFFLYDDFIKVFNKNIAEERQLLIDAISIFLKAEFNNQIGVLPDGILLYKNKEKSILEGMVEILQNSNKPLHFSEINDILQKMGVKAYTSRNVHSILLNENKIFGLKGAGIYDLRIKGGRFGSIGDVAEQILLEKKSPIRFKKLEDTICTELVVARNSIKRILLYYKNEKRFKRFENDLIGLAGW